MFIWNGKLPLPQERASFSKLKSLCICIFSIIHNQVMANLEIPPLTFQGVIFRKVLGIELFYFNQLVFREKQPYIPNFVEIGVGVVLFFQFFGWSHREFPYNQLKFPLFCKLCFRRQKHFNAFTALNEYIVTIYHISICFGNI